MEEIKGPQMRDFISQFHRMTITLNCKAHDWIWLDEMKLSHPQCMVVSTGLAIHIFSGMY